MRVFFVKSSCSVVALAVGVLGAVPAVAQQPIELPEIVVDPPKARTKTKATGASGVTAEEPVVSPTAVVTPSEQVANSVTVITGEELERKQIRTLADALRTVPGLNVVQSGGPGRLTTVFVRGMESNHVKVFIDGIDASDASITGGLFDFGNFVTSDVERIEVLRGPQSGLYGANAMGGVISIITKQGKGPLKMIGVVEGGSLGTLNQYVGASGSEGGFHYAFNLGHIRSMEIPVTPLGLLPPGGRRNEFYDNWTYSTKMGVDLTRDFSINWVARYTVATLDFTDDGFAGPLAPQATTDTRQFFGRGEAVWSTLGGAFKNYFGFSHTDQVRKTVSPSPFVAPSLEGERTKYDWRGVATIAPGQVIVMGLETQTERAITPDTRFEQDNNAGYIELQSEIAKRLFLVGNVRHDDNENWGGHTTWRFAPAFIVPGSETKLKGSVGTGFKPPSLDELFGPFSANPALLPEESKGYDIGFEQPLFGDKLRFGVTYFHNDITNLIGFDPITFQAINIDRAKTSGYELFAAAVLSSKFGVRLDYTYTEAINLTTGDDLLRRPKHKASVTSIWTPYDAFSLTTTLLYVGERADFDRVTFDTLTMPGFVTVNLAADYKLDDKATLFGRVDNLFDVHYQDTNGFDRPGLSVFAGIRLTNRP